MAKNTEDQEEKSKGRFNPVIILVAIALVVVILLIVWLATRNNRAAIAPSPSPAVESPVPSLSPALSPASEWTAARLEQIIKENTPIHFVKDTARLLKGEEAKVEAIAAALKHYGNIQLRFRGHTADFNLKKYQYKLSVLRASKIRWMLEYRAGEGITSVTVQGAGSKEPISKGNSEAQRAPNRRVEIILQNAEPK